MNCTKKQPSLAGNGTKWYKKNELLFNNNLETILWEGIYILLKINESKGTKWYKKNDKII